jgi:LacI family transcriptional regulator
MLSEKRIDGMIIISTGEGKDLQRMLHGLPIPMVLLDREIDEANCDLVETAHLQGGLMATNHLIGLGHRRIACLAGPANLNSSAQRIEGWRQALATAGLAEESADLLWHSDFSSQGGFRTMQSILASSPVPTAVFVCNDLMSIGALSAAHEAGIQIPQDMSLIGFDDIELARFASPALTTIAQPKLRIGIAAVDMLLERIQGGRIQARQLILQPELIVRHSTAGLC